MSKELGCVPCLWCPAVCQVLRMQRPVGPAPSWLVLTGFSAYVSSRETCLEPAPSNLPRGGPTWREQSYSHLSPRQPGGPLHAGPCLLCTVPAIQDSCQMCARFSVNIERKEKHPLGWQRRWTQKPVMRRALWALRLSAAPPGLGSEQPSPRRCEVWSVLP